MGCEKDGEFVGFEENVVRFGRRAWRLCDGCSGRVDLGIVGYSPCRSPGTRVPVGVTDVFEAVNGMGTTFHSRLPISLQTQCSRQLVHSGYDGHFP